MLPIIFKPSKEYELIRLGSNNEGGYLVEKNSILNSTSLISFGLAYDWSFEKDYYNLKKCPIYCYDHTINYSIIKKYSRQWLGRLIKRLFNPKYFLKIISKNTVKNILLYRDYKNFFIGNVSHTKSRIGTGSSDLKLKDALNATKSIPTFLKVDIEGSEYRILEEIITYQKNFTGLAIEFHNVDLNLDKITNFIKNFSLTLVHIHAENQASVAGNNIPLQIEFTFAKNPKIVNSRPKIPHELDQPSNPNLKDIELFFQN